MKWLYALGVPSSDTEDLAQEVFLVVRRRLSSSTAETSLRGSTGSPSSPRAITGGAPGSRTSSVGGVRWSWPRCRTAGRRRSTATRTRRVAAGCRSCRAHMSEKLRATFVLFEIEGYSGEEIAQHPGHPARHRLDAPAQRAQGVLQAGQGPAPARRRRSALTCGQVAAKPRRWCNGDGRGSGWAIIPPVTMRVRSCLIAVVPLVLAGGGCIAHGPAGAGAEPDKATAVEAPPLRSVSGARRIGAAVESQRLREPMFAKVLAANFNSLTPENEMKWAYVEPAPGQFAFRGGDALVAFAAPARHAGPRAHARLAHAARALGGAPGGRGAAGRDGGARPGRGRHWKGSRPVGRGERGLRRRGGGGLRTDSPFFRARPGLHRRGLSRGARGGSRRASSSTTTTRSRGRTRPRRRPSTGWCSS